MICFPVLCMLLLLAGCDRSDKTETPSFSGETMTIPYRVIIGKTLSYEEERDVKKIVFNTFDEIDRIYNKWNPESEISQLNLLKAGVKVPISGELEAFLQETDRLISLSDGKFDPTVEAAQKIWNESLKKGQLPSKESQALANEGVGWKKIHILNGQFWKDHDQLALDLGAIAKGFAIDLTVERLNQAGFMNVFMEWGGEIGVSGNHPSGRPWRIFISALGSPNASVALDIVDMHDNAVASSGDYLQNWTVNDTTYFHIFDPETGRPLVATETSVCSATVIASNCRLADFLATTAMLHPSKRDAEIWLESIQMQIPDVRYWIETRKDLQNEKPQKP